jgi:hypothetical protein
MENEGKGGWIKDFVGGRLYDGKGREGEGKGSLLEMVMN